MSLRLFIGGMRGSRPCTGAAFEVFGGHTTSLLVLGSQGERLVLDAGSGLCSVADQLAGTEAGEVTVLFSHYHLDHMMGLTMNPLFFHADWRFRCVGPTLAEVTVQEAVTRILAPPYWPVSTDHMNAKIEFSEFPAQGLKVGGLSVRACSVSHPGGCLAYRIEDTISGACLVFATDMEWQGRTPQQESAFLDLCRNPKPADLLVMDAHFDQAQAEAFAGWGHSCWQDDLEIAELSAVSRVLLGHHAPEAHDKRLCELETQVQQVMPNASMARAGQWINME